MNDYRKSNGIRRTFRPEKNRKALDRQNLQLRLDLARFRHDVKAKNRELDLKVRELELKEKTFEHSKRLDYAKYFLASFTFALSVVALLLKL